MARSYAAFVRQCWEENRLLSVLVELGYQCPLRCVFCYNDRQAPARQLTLDQYLTLLRDASELGAIYLTLSGGEPTVHPYFFTVGAEARKLGFVVRVKSAGSHLTRTMIRRIREELDPMVVELSLHGATAAIHERQTRVDGSFSGLMRAISAFQAEGQRIELRSVLTRWNEDELEAMFELARRLGVPLRVDPRVTPRDDGDRSPLQLTASEDAIRRLLRLGIAVEEKDSTPGGNAGACPQPEGSYYCGAGTGAVAVDPNGNVLPCVQWRRPVGNLHRHNLREIWERSTGLKTVREQNASARRALNVIPGSEMLGFCPALALEDGGVADRPGPREWLRRRLVREMTKLDATHLPSEDGQQAGMEGTR